ncbi:MAG TPA: type III ribulose-bisphosphate carboxylase [bacterium]|nr:type III ribulose-bisphosphate carboxylase [bacterium]
MSQSYSYLRVGESVNPEKYLIAEFYVEPKGVSFIEAAEAIAGESSIGTWTSLSTMNQEIYNRLAPKIFEVKKLERDGDPDTEEGIVKIAYPLDLWEEGNIAQLLSGIAGNVFGMNTLQNLRLIDLHFPQSYIDTFQGPEFGIEGVRNIVEIFDRPLIGTIIKPKCGLPPDEHARVAYESWVGGCDIVKDDENLTDQVFNPFEERITKSLEMRDRAEQETGRKKIYVANITAESDEMLRRAEFVKKHGGRCVMIDILTAGFSGVKYIRRQKLGLIMHGHRAMHAAFTNNYRHGISMMCIAKVSRLAGIDQLHTGTVIGKMEGTKDEVLKINEVMRTKWGKIKTTFPIASGGLHPGLSVELVKLLGKDFIVNYGGGIHGHPDGTREGARAVYQSIEAAMQGKRLYDYARDPGRTALAKAIEKWGVYGNEKDKNVSTYKYTLLNNDKNSINMGNFAA